MEFIKMNKKVYMCIGIIIIIAIIVALVILSNNSKTTEETASPKEDYYSAKYKDQQITVGDKFTDDLIAEDFQMSEVENCAFATADKVYTYANFEIVPATVNNETVIYSIYFITDEIATSEGLKLGDSLATILDTYGEDYSQPLSNKYVYQKGKTELSFIIENETIVSIEYTLLTD